MSSQLEAKVHWEGVAKARLMSSQLEAKVHWEGVFEIRPNKHNHIVDRLNEKSGLTPALTI